jgi:hypothetical protein
VKFQKKPVVIEAFEFTAEAKGDEHSWPSWLKDASKKRRDIPGAFYNSEFGFLINTLEGKHTVSEGDWIIRGVKGELYPCKPDIFDLTYEAVE